MRGFQLPGPEWSARSFASAEAAQAFYLTLVWSGFEPSQITEDQFGPAGEVFRAGSWLVTYQVFKAPSE